MPGFYLAHSATEKCIAPAGPSASIDPMSAPESRVEPVFSVGDQTGLMFNGTPGRLALIQPKRHESVHEKSLLKVKPSSISRKLISPAVPTAAASQDDLVSHVGVLEPDLALLKKRARYRGYTRLILAALSIGWGAAVGIVGLGIVMAILLLISAAKWFTISGSTAQLERWQENQENREDMDGKAKLVAALKWILAIPIALAMFILFLFRDF